MKTNHSAVNSTAQLPFPENSLNVHSVKSFNYNGSKVTFRQENALMVNATQMAKQFNKQPVQWLRYQQSQEFLDKLSKLRNHSLADLVQVRKGGSAPGTWFHEDVALEFARWLSPEFAIWCNDKIKELLTQGVTTTISNFNPKNFVPLKEHHRLQSETSNLNALVEHWKHQAERYAELYERALRLAELMSQNMMRLACATDKELQPKAEQQEAPNWYSIVGYASRLGFDCGIKQASVLGRKASALCKSRSISPEEIPDPRFGSIKTYPESVLKEIFETR